MISSLKIKLNCSWKFWRNWNVPLVLLERSWWAGFNGIYLVRFGFRMWEMLIFNWFVLLKIQINSKKTRFFGRKNSVEDVVTLGPMAQAKLVIVKWTWGLKPLGDNPFDPNKKKVVSSKKGHWEAYFGKWQLIIQKLNILIPIDFGTHNIVEFFHFSYMTFLFSNEWRRLGCSSFG
jgi:hypothetical protein